MEEEAAGYREAAELPRADLEGTEGCWDECVPRPQIDPENPEGLEVIEVCGDCDSFEARMKSAWNDVDTFFCFSCGLPGDGSLDSFLASLGPLGNAFRWPATIATVNAARAGIGGAEAAAAINVVFKTSHYASRLEKAGLDVGKTENAVRSVIEGMRGSVWGPGSVFAGRMTVEGTLIEYNAFVLPSGSVSVGTIFAVL